MPQNDVMIFMHFWPKPPPNLLQLYLSFTWIRRQPSWCKVHASLCMFLQTPKWTPALVDFIWHVGVFVYNTQTIMTIKSGVGAVKKIPMERCELCGALNLFGCCCQANEVREWGQPGGGRGQPRASTACQAAVLQGSCPGPHCGSAVAQLWHVSAYINSQAWAHLHQSFVDHLHTQEERLFQIFFFFFRKIHFFIHSSL